MWFFFLLFSSLFLLHAVSALDNGLGQTPPLGWNSWNHFACDVNEALIMETADAMVESGMKDAGYVAEGMRRTYQILDCYSLGICNESGLFQYLPSWLQLSY